MDQLDETEGAGTTSTLASFAAELRYEDLPDHVRHQAKRIIIDTLACIIGAHPYPAATIVESVALSIGGTAEARVVPAGFRTSAPMAAFVNSELANLLD